MALDGKRERPYETVKPLADSVQGVTFNNKIDRDDKDGVAAFVSDYVKNYNGQGNVLICWEHKELQDLAQAIIQSDGVGSAGTEVPEYPGDR